MGSFLWRVWIRKLVKRSLIYIGGLAAAGLATLAPTLQEAGISIQLDEVAVAAFLLTTVEGLRSYLKHKKGLKWL